jgi:natural product biosynthesis luciferase-like monooxygenase protein/amino acid adenylation domain-containing protein
MQELLNKLNKLGIKINLLEGDLNITAPRGVMTDQLLQELKEYKAQIVALLNEKERNTINFEPISKIEKSDSYDLSSAQHRLWLQCQTNDANRAYNMANTFRFKGLLKIDSLEKAFISTIEKHEALRTNFILNDQGVPVQIIRPTSEVNFSLDFQDLRGAEDAEIKLTESLNVLANIEFNLSIDNLIRAKLYQVASDEYVVLFVVHHIVSDAWSMEIIKKEIFRFYEANIDHCKIPVHENSIQYRDFASWQKKQLQSQDFIKNVNFWKSILPTKPSKLNFPWGNADDNIKTFIGEIKKRTFSKSVFENLKHVFKDQEATTFMGIVALVNLLIYKYTSQTDITLGTPVSGRQHPDLENQVGFYVNLIPLRSQIDSTGSFADLVKKIKEGTIQAFQHQNIPFDKLLDSLSLTKNELFDIVVTLKPKEENDSQISVGELKFIEEQILERTSSKFYLEFLFVEIGEELELELTFNPNEIAPWRIDVLLEHLAFLAESIVEFPKKSINELNLLSQPEAEKIKLQFNKTNKDYLITTPYITLFQQQVHFNAEKIAIIDGEKSMTYESLNEYSDKIACKLIAEEKIHRGDVVMVKLNRSIDLVASLLGILKAGAVYLPVDSLYPSERIAYMQEDSEARICITENYLQHLPVSNTSLLSKVKRSPTDIAYIVYTSGSTGQPKGVQISNSSLVNLCFWHKDQYQLKASSRSTIFSGIAFDASIWEICPYLLFGASLYPIKNDDIRMDLNKLLEFIESAQITHCFLPTQICKLLANHNGVSKDLWLITGGEELILPNGTKNRIFNNYGPSENTVVATSYEVKSDDFTNIPIGKPIANTEIHILDDDLKPLPIGFTGTIYISGKSLSSGYLKRPELTKERFITHPEDSNRIIYNSGDLGYWMPDGNIGYMGRSDLQFQLRGFRIEPGEVESVILNSVKNISQVVVFLKLFKGKEVLIAYYIGSYILNVEKVKKKLGEKLPAYMIPSLFIRIDEIPLTPNGKVNFNVLPEPKLDKLEDLEKKELPYSELEKKLAVIWESVLAIEKIGINQSIFDYGGSSISIAKFINKLKIETSYDIEFRDILKNPCIKDMLPYLKTVEASPILPVPRAKFYPLSTSQFRFWLLCQLPETNKAYNIPFVLRMRGDINEKLIQTSVNHLIKRHESLRTQFVTSGNGDVVQEIKDFDTLETVIEIREFDISENPETVLKEFCQSPFILDQAPLLRTGLFKSEEESYLVIVAHHIVFDGYSLEVFLNELSESYNWLLEGKEKMSESKLPQIQYKDYVYWKNQALDAVIAKEKAFWLHELSGELPKLNLPTFQPRPNVQTYGGETRVCELSTTLHEQIKKYSATNNVTSFNILFAATVGLLFKYTRQTDIILGTPVNGRDHASLEDQIGLYINTVPLRTKFDKSDSFSDLVDIQRDLLGRVMANSSFSFADIINILDIKRDLSRSPVFDVMIIHQSKNIDKFNLQKAFNGIHCEPYEDLNFPVSKYDITFSFIEFENSVTLHLEYNTDLFQRAFIDAMLANFNYFLNKCFEKSSKALSSLDFIDFDQKAQIVNQFNNTGIAIEKEISFLDLFNRQIEINYDKIAVKFGSDALTYRELDQRSSSLATALLEAGVKKGIIVGLMAERSVELLIGILGILKAGAIYLPLDPFYPLDRTDYILKDSEASFIVGTEKIKSLLPDTVPFIDVNCADTLSSKDRINFPSLNSNDSAYLIYTSGSTGNPKGVEVSHGNLYNFLIGMGEIFKMPLENNEIWLAVTSISFDISILELIWTLSRGSSVVIHPELPIPFSEKPKMDFSIFYFPTYSSDASGFNKYKLLIDGSKFADNNNFEAIWVPERHFHSFGDQFPNPSIAAAAVSTITKKIKLRSGSVVLPLHDPVRVAEEWSMVDNLSSGRVELSIASGWHPNDFVLGTGNYENRHQEMRDGIDTLRNLWNGGSLTRKNGLNKDFSFKIHPTPVQKNLNIWITAAGSIETFKYAGRIGANILTHLLGQGFDELSEKIQIYRETLKEHGYDPKTRKVALMLHTFLGEDVNDVKHIVEEPFKNYLSNSLNLLKPLAEELGLDLENDKEPLLEVGFNRFFNTGSLFGTPESCLEIIENVYKIGIDEIACLIDFGINENLVVDHFQYLGKLQNLTNRRYNQYQFMQELIDSLSEESSTASLIEKFQITHMQSTPSFFQELLEQSEGKNSLPQLETILVGGEALKQSLADKMHTLTSGPIYNMYGPTETTIWSSVGILDNREGVHIGKPIANTEIYIMDEYDNICPVGVYGEICISGKGVSKGYYNRSDLTDRKFINHPFTEGKKLYRTGDIGRWDFQGQLNCVGRIDHQVKINGYRVELQEIENVIHKVSGILQTAVCKINENDESKLVAYIKSDNKVTPETLKEKLQLQIPYFMVPKVIIEVNEFPLTPNGKIDISKLPKPGDEISTKRILILPENDIEKKLIDVWATFLDRNDLSVDDNFFEIGGNSMKAFQLLTAVNQKLQIQLKILVFFQYPTIRKLAAYIKNLDADDSSETTSDELENVEDVIDFMNDL